MKAKKVYQISLVLVGLLLSFCGIACLIAGTLLGHDSMLKTIHESRSRTYSTQYWLGLPLIAFGGLLMLMSPTLHKRKRMAVFNIFVCIQLLACTLVAAILHGTTYVHFLSIQQNRVYFQDHGYTCSEIITDHTICRCSKQDLSPVVSTSVDFAVPCSQQKPLVGCHGSLLAFSAIAFSLLLGVLVISVIFILHFFKLQFAIGSNTLGQENRGFSRARDHTNTLSIHTSTSLPDNPPPHISQDQPPSYESLLQRSESFAVTSRSMTSTNNVTTPGGRLVNRQARVRHRGQLSSRAIRGRLHPERTQQEESSSNEVLSSEEHGNETGETQMMAVTETDNAATQNTNSLGRYTRQLSDELNRITENMRAVANTMYSPTQTDSNQNILETRSRGSSQNTHPSNDHDRRHQQSATNRIHNTTSEQSRQQIFETDPSSTSEMVANERNQSRLIPHGLLEQTASGYSDDRVCIDIIQSTPLNCVPTSDSTHIAVRYRGQMDSNTVNHIQTQSQLTQQQEEGQCIVDVRFQDSTVRSASLHPADETNTFGSRENASFSNETSPTIHDATPHPTGGHGSTEEVSHTGTAVTVTEDHSTSRQVVPPASIERLSDNTVREVANTDNLSPRQISSGLTEQVTDCYQTSGVSTDVARQAALLDEEQSMPLDSNESPDSRSSQMPENINTQNSREIII